MMGCDWMGLDVIGWDWMEMRNGLRISSISSSDGVKKIGSFEVGC